MENNQTVPVVESPGAYYPQDFSIQTLNLLTASGQRFELKRLLVELSYYEDIYSFVTSGYITLIDAQGFLELFQLSGNEFIEINFGKIRTGSNSTDQLFRVYKTSDRKPSGNLNSEVYTLYFCSEELLLSEQIKISKSYSGKKISEIIENILTEKLKVKKKNIQLIEETIGLYDFVIPRLKPFEAISWLSTYARPKVTGVVGADMLFFETKNGFNYRSLQSMFRDPIYATYRYQAKNIEDSIQDFQEKTITVLDYEFVKTYDALKDINAGTFANKLISIDPLARTFKTTEFNYKDYFDKKKTAALNDNSVLVPLRNRLGKTQNESYDSRIKVLTSNAAQNQLQYVKDIPGSVAKDIAIENYIPLRTAQLGLANYTVAKITIPGDPGITVGRTIDFNLLTLKPSTNKKELDRYYSGTYLVTAVRHIITSAGAYQTVLEITKDSSPTAYSQINNNSPEFRKVVDE
jgi:hypothetical protein